MSRFEQYIDEMCGKDHKKKKKKKVDENGLNENYTQKELSLINPKAETVNIQVSDYDGNKTKYLGMNDKQSLTAMKKFIEVRMKNV